MSGIIDGSFDTPEGRKLFVRQRPDESSDDFTTRMLAFMLAMENGQTLDVVLASGPADWEILPSPRWLEARNRTYPELRLRVTAVSSDDGRIKTWQANLWSLAHEIKGLGRNVGRRHPEGS